jgi:SnoaL-like domain
VVSESTFGRTESGALVMSPFDHVRAQLSRQKWAVDSQNAAALWNIYAANYTLVLKHEGKEETARIVGRDDVIAFQSRGFNNVTPRVGSMIHHIGTVMVEPAENGMIRCWSYANYVHVVESGATESHGYGKYHDLWTFEEGLWRLLEREVHIFGLDVRGVVQSHSEPAEA